MEFSDAIEIAGLYFTLISILSSIFFINLINWLISIYSLEARWEKVKNKIPTENFFHDRLDCFVDAKFFSNILNLISWLIISAFLTLIIIKLEFLRMIFPINEFIPFTIFLSIPIYYFMAIYFLASILTLILGYSKANSLKKEINNRL